MAPRTRRNVTPHPRFPAARGRRPEPARPLHARLVDAKPQKRSRQTHGHADRELETLAVTLYCEVCGASWSSYLKDAEKCALTAVRTFGVLPPGVTLLPPPWTRPADNPSFVEISTLSDFKPSVFWSSNSQGGKCRAHKACPR